MARRRRTGPRPHKFRNKLILNQWLISLFGIDPLQEQRLNGKIVRPIHRLVEPIKDPRMEGLDEQNIHRFFHNLVDHEMFSESRLSRMQLLGYEENIVRHTQRINENRHRPITWKYYQWLTLLFAEIYLDRYFNDRQGLLDNLNGFVDQFNQCWDEYADVPEYTDDDLNKLCLQNATGSGKTLIMHVNLLQFQHYSKQVGRDDELSRVILLTPNERLSEQHIDELHQSGIASEWFVGGRGTLFTTETKGLRRVDVLEITKLADQEGPNTIATRSLGDQNLMLVDEGHRGMSGKDEGAWVTRRNMLCEKGFTFEYSATFEQAIAAAKDDAISNSYAKSILFDYSYRYFYEDGFGKDYHILNLPTSLGDTQSMYLAACLLKFYQQLRIYDDKRSELVAFNLEKPLWVFVGSSVQKASGKKFEKETASDVAQVLQFVANFLHDPEAATQCINTILAGTGQQTGLLDEDGNDIFAGSFNYLAREMNAGETAAQIYQDILDRLFRNRGGGRLVLSRVQGDSGEIALKCGVAEEPFGLINVGDAKGLCDHCEEVCEHLDVADSEFSEAMFSAVKDSSSPVNLLIGSKKFVEGWDCWRVSTMGLMHVGKSEGSQIIQLFGRGIRLKGWQWSLKRSGHTFAPQRPQFIEELETLDIFGIEADFMERFRDFLKEEGLPGNERKKIITIPLNVLPEPLGKKLKILRPKRKAGDGREYDFKRDAPVPTMGDIPEYLRQNRVESDWYPRIQAVWSKGQADAGQKHDGVLDARHLSLLNFDELFLDVESFKRERTWHNLNVSKDGIRKVLSDPSWYRLLIPSQRLDGAGYENAVLWQQVALELLKRYVDRLYKYRKREFIEPRLELRDLTAADDNFPDADEYQLIVDGAEEQLVQQIHQIKENLETSKDELLRVGNLCAGNFGAHLYQPLFHVKRGGKIKVMPVALNESEYQFVEDLVTYSQDHGQDLAAGNLELYLLRNMSRGRGVGFFEAGGFYPDFILWLLAPDSQHVAFIEPHGLLHEGPASEKIQFHSKIKQVEQRLGDPAVTLDSFILSWSRHALLQWGMSREDLNQRHVFFMTEDRTTYVQGILDAMQQAQSQTQDVEA